MSTPETSVSVKVFQCPLCDWKTTKMHAVSQHMRWSHPGMKHCPKCLAVMEQSQLAQHVERHLEDRETCPHCGKLVSYRQIKKHIGMAHGKNHLNNPELRQRAMKKRGQNMEYRQYLSERMKRCNPMDNLEVREKMASKMREYFESGRMLPFGGRIYGNGQEMTPAEQYMMSLYPNASYQHVVTMNDGLMPAHYKIDVAWPDLMIALELDGSSHSRRDRKDADVRKDARLKSLRWQVIRVKNADALSGRVVSLLSEYGITQD